MKTGGVVRITKRCASKLGSLGWAETQVYNSKDVARPRGYEDE